MCVFHTATLIYFGEEKIAELRRLVADDGVAIVSVPVETGPPLALKQAARALAARRGVEGYVDRERYTIPELLRMTLAGAETRIERPVYTSRFASGKVSTPSARVIPSPS